MDTPEIKRVFILHIKYQKRKKENTFKGQTHYRVENMKPSKEFK